MVNQETPPSGGTTTKTSPAADDSSAPVQPGRQRTTTPTRATNATQQPLRRRHRRPEMIQKKREERYKQFERRQRQWRYTKYSLIAVGALIVLALGVVVWNAVQDRIDEAALDDVQEYSYAGGEHVEGDLTYTENPPVGGPHNQIWQQCGYYDAPVPEENAVHSMEHGAVWITYRPDLPADQIAKLKEKADNNDYLLVSPRPDLPAPVVLSSWNRQLQVDSADDRAVDAFIRTYRRNADTTPEMNATCSGGNTTTLPA
jgi:hypothetical protein